MLLITRRFLLFGMVPFLQGATHIYRVVYTIVTFFVYSMHWKRCF